MKKLTFVLISLISLSLIFSSCSMGTTEETTLTAEETTLAPVNGEETNSAENVFAEQDETTTAAENEASATEETEYTVG